MSRLMTPKTKHGQPIRLLLRTKQGLIKMCYMITTPTCVVGWYMGDWLKKQLGLPLETHLDCHFTYPLNGNYHNSYKSITEDREIYITVSWNNVKIKTITDGYRDVTHL